MFFLILVIGCAVVMGKVASSEGRSVVLWSVGTAVVCFLCGALIPLGLLGILIGLVLCFAAMVALKMIHGNIA